MKYDVTGIGNAIVDVLVNESDEFLAAQSLTKGAMTLVDEQRAAELYAKLPAGIECSGGSAGNTMAGIASLGGRGAYIGKVANDQLGDVFAHDLRAIGVAFSSRPAEGASTARCLIVVTPDAQRTMSTYLGACVQLGPGDIDDEVIVNSKVTYLEGYLWDPPGAKEAFLKAARLAHQAGQKVSLSLSDPFCVDRHRESFQELVNDHVDIVFANEAEIMSLYQADTFEDAKRAVAQRAEIAVLTRSELGAVVLRGEEEVAVPAEPADVVDTTGAGDIYAAGFLYGYTQGRNLADCGRIASLCASEIISHYGARPAVSLGELVKSKLGA
ncbi:MAG: adenosine kinase [Myxococcota bacterium]